MVHVALTVLEMLNKRREILSRVNCYDDGRYVGSNYRKTEDEEVQHEVGRFLYKSCIFIEDCFILDDNETMMMIKVNYIYTSTSI